MAIVSMIPDYVEINRTFHAITSAASEKDADYSDLLIPTGKELTWLDVENDWRVVVISEAGAARQQKLSTELDSCDPKGRPPFSSGWNFCWKMMKKVLKSVIRNSLKLGCKATMKVGFSLIPWMKPNLNMSMILNEQ